MLKLFEFLLALTYNSILDESEVASNLSYQRLLVSWLYNQHCCHVTAGNPKLRFSSDSGCLCWVSVSTFMLANEVISLADIVAVSQVQILVVFHLRALDGRCLGILALQFLPAHNDLRILE